jgi:hypothetical protein
VRRAWYLHVAWIAGAALLGFAIAAVFSGALQWPRRFYLLPYVGLGGLFIYAFLRWNRLSLVGLLRHNWRQGLLGAVVVGIATVGLILAQAPSERLPGWWLVVDLVWSGTAYAVVDAFLLSVIPVLSAWRAFSELGWTKGSWGRMAARVAGFVASLFVSGVYHAGFAQYRGPAVMGAVVGNAVFTLGYVLTGSPLAPVLGHVAMHVAGVLHGPGTVNQLPPHYY